MMVLKKLQHVLPIHHIVIYDYWPLLTRVNVAGDGPTFKIINIKTRSIKGPNYSEIKGNQLLIKTI